MNPEIQKLQYLNNLVTQTLDILTRQQMNVLPTVNPYHTGLTHTPWTTTNTGYGLGTNMHTMPVGTPYQMGLSHTGYTHNPHWAQNWNVPMTDYNFVGMHPGYTQGLTHTPYYTALGYNMNVPFVDPRYGWINPTTPVNYNW